MVSVGDCFAMIFVAQKCISMFKTFANCSRSVRDTCEDFEMPSERWRRFRD